LCICLLLLFFFFFFFFFQAEDGIRDLYVTGVQTCALPIWPSGGRGGRPASSSFRTPITTSKIGQVLRRPQSGTNSSSRKIKPSVIRMTGPVKLRRYRDEDVGAKPITSEPRERPDSLLAIPGS